MTPVVIVAKNHHHPHHDLHIQPKGSNPGGKPLTFGHCSKRGGVQPKSKSVGVVCLGLLLTLRRKGWWVELITKVLG